MAFYFVMNVKKSSKSYGMSAPAMKQSGFEETRTALLTDGSDSILDKISWNSERTSRFSEFTCGRDHVHIFKKVVYLTTQ